MRHWTFVKKHGCPVRSDMITFVIASDGNEKSQRYRCQGGRWEYLEGDCWYPSSIEIMAWRPDEEEL